jgi:hypothetical protein
VFKKILNEEEFHEKAFRTFTTPEAYSTAKKHHMAGAKELGLLP